MNTSRTVAVVAFTLVAGLVIYDTAHCLTGSPAHHEAAPTPIASQPTQRYVTNHFPRSITNVIEVRMPINVFRDEYRTNWVEQFTTNFVDVFQTNWLQKTLTNTIVVEITQTNWEAALAFKTNWVMQSITNVVEINLPLRSPASPSGPAQPEKPTKPVRVPNPKVIGQAHGLSIELVRTEKALRNNQAEIQLTLNAANDSDALQVQEWQLVRADGTVLLFGQRRQFTAEIAAGSYKVMVKARQNEKPPTLSVSGYLEITAAGTIQGSPTMALNASQ